MRRLYEYFFIEDEVTKSRGFLFDSPSSLAILLACYVALVKVIGPMYMAKRPAYNIDKILIGYNVFQIFINTYITAMTIPLILNNSITCSEVDHFKPNFKLEMEAIELYYFTKFLDFLDTIFFVLRKNYRQVSLLHVYHHCAVLHGSWAALKYAPGGHSLYVPCINSFVHVVMYGYYLLTVYKPEYKTSLWWKKHITQLQFVQFFSVVVIYLQPLIRPCKYPPVIAFLIASQTVFVTYLFGKFYYKNYIKKKL